MSWPTIFDSVIALVIVLLTVWVAVLHSGVQELSERVEDLERKDDWS